MEEKNITLPEDSQMSATNAEVDEDIVYVKRKHRKAAEEDENGRGRFFALRQVLNLLFMIIAIAGVVIYLTQNEMQGVIVVVIAMAFKMAECVFRYLK